MPRKKPAHDASPPAPARIVMPRRTRAATGAGKKAVVTFRLTDEINEYLRKGAKAHGISYTDFFVLCLRTVQGTYGLSPDHAAALEREREELGMNTFEYEHFIKFMRVLEIRRKGAGFDLPERDQKNLGIKGPGRGRPRGQSR